MIKKVIARYVIFINSRQPRQFKKHLENTFLRKLNLKKIGFLRFICMWEALNHSILINEMKVMRSYKSYKSSSVWIGDYV